jgi:membrane fusion protein (multidrug efflux system)
MTSVSQKAIAVLAASVAAVSIVLPVSAQQPAPAVGVVEVVKRPITERSEFLGRIEAVERVNVVARLNAFLDKRLFKEGHEVKANDLLYRLQRGPFEADLQARKAQVAQLEAMLANARITTDRQQTLLKSPAGLQSSYDSAIANQKSLEAQLQAAEAQVSLAEINLGYADIRSPIDGKIDRTTVTEGNVVGPGSGTLTTIVSQDPMYVTFPISVREALTLRERYAAKGVRNAVVIRVKLPDGRIYGQIGRVNFASNSITRTTDTILVRGTIPNPKLNPGSPPIRELTDGELVTVILEGAQPVEVLAIPRTAVLTDQQGNYALIVGADNKVEQRRIQTGQSTTTVASIASGLSLGDKVIAEGLQHVKPGQVVAPAPASAAVQATLKQSELTGPTAPAPAVQAIPASSTRGLNR